MSYHIYIPRDLEIQAGKKKLQYCFCREALLYDISNYCYVQGQVIGEEIENARHMTIDVAQDGNIDRVTRVLNLAFDEVVELLYRITKDEVDDKSEYTNEFHVPESYHVTMNVYDKFSITTANLLQTLIHELSCMQSCRRLDKHHLCTPQAGVDDKGRRPQEED
ncbi:hypothetical protein [Porphyromonas sp. COT-108 OH1349]|uniref:hypothetical protein n=1 Tax=Porphyromonas sp. COT-108 OH1349 TaxID=1537504 RepID=UPI00068DC7BB|nr:hypothetical protein [Porphyromonas sp. COT-108 OH1349]